MPDAFDRYEVTDAKSNDGDAFDRYPTPEQDESWWRSAARKALQIPQGIAEVTGPGLWAGLWHMLALGETELGVDELQRLREIGEREGKPFDEEAYEAARQNALSYIPTVSNIARGVEEATGIPLEPKTRFEKGLRFASSAAKIIPKPNPEAPLGYGFRGTNTALPRPILGAGVEAAKEIGVELGVPEPIADIASFGVVKSIPSGGSKLTIGKETKPSGMTKRRYENLEAPYEVPKSKINQINEAVENEFRQLTDEIIEKSPIKETHQALANDVTFKKNARERFKEVEALAETLPREFETSQVKSDLQNLISNKKNKGLTPSEFDKSHNKFIQQFIKETPDKSFTTKEIVAQYRKNNGQLAEAYEPGQSFAYNRAKREALLDYNRSLAAMIEREFPGSEFSNLFKETNAKWAEISNSEAITKYLDNIFKEDKINYTKARQLFDKDGMTLPFKRALGEEGFAKFETLVNDLISTQKGMKYLKAAEQQGFTELAKMAGSYLLHPTLNKFHLGYKALKGGYNKIFEMLLDKPSLAVTWDRGINAMKKGDFKAAEKEFTKVKTAEAVFDAKDHARKETLKKFNDLKRREAAAHAETIEVEPIKASSPPSPPSPLKKQTSSNLPAVVQKSKAEAAPKKPTPSVIENKGAETKRLEHKPQAKAAEKAAPIFEDEAVQAAFDELQAENMSSSKSEIEKAKLQEIYDDVASELRSKQKKEVEPKAKPKEPAQAVADDMRYEINTLKEQRDAIQGRSQEAIKQRLPLNEKINELELELYNYKKNTLKYQMEPRRPVSETIKDLQFDIEAANDSIAYWKQEKYHTSKYKEDRIKEAKETRQKARDKIFEIKNKETVVANPNQSALAELEAKSSKLREDMQARDARHGRDFSVQEGEEMIDNLGEFIKLKKEERKLASKMKNAAKLEDIDRFIESATNSLKLYTEQLKNVRKKAKPVVATKPVEKPSRVIETNEKKLAEEQAKKAERQKQIEKEAAEEAARVERAAQRENEAETKEPYVINTAEEGYQAQLKEINEFIKLKKEEKKQAIQAGDVAKEEIIDKELRLGENAKKRVNDRLKDLKNRQTEKKIIANLDKKSFSESDIRSTMREIINTRKLKEQVKGSSVEAKQQRSGFEKKIRELEDIYHKNKKAADAAAPDLRKYPKPEISKDALIRQKDFIVDAIEKALKNPPPTEKLRIEVPGDGTFTIWNIEEVLEEFMKKVKKDWPVTQVGKSKAHSYPKIKERPSTPLSAYKSEGLKEGMWDMKDNDSIYK